MAVRVQCVAPPLLPSRETLSRAQLWQLVLRGGEFVFVALFRPLFGPRCFSIARIKRPRSY